MVLISFRRDRRFYHSLRFLLRRKQCLYITGILSLIVALLVLLVFGALYFYNSSMEQCNKCGNASFVHLAVRTMNRDDLTCVHLSHRAKCFDQNVKCNTLANRPYKQCEGLRGIPVRESEAFMNQTVVSQQIVALCPRCHFFGRPYHSSMDTCVQKLRTMRPGWPSEFQWCDWYQPSDKCI
ncbi:hypothetical protein X798_03969 [Onchocerca flexuosa]|uniref:Uncharacterized protein n=1 Tax=Onchocerca flexuosa TaxID=387005 RepID=A0A238BWT2_9BILA|nr:hypothetical protein X798_03969 [Onchocerca flexuosa]